MCTNTYHDIRCPRLRFSFSAPGTTTHIFNISQHIIMCTKSLSCQTMFFPLPLGTRHPGVTKSNATSIFKTSAAHLYVPKSFYQTIPYSRLCFSLFLFARRHNIYIYIYIQNSAAPFYVSKSLSPPPYVRGFSSLRQTPQHLYMCSKFSSLLFCVQNLPSRQLCPLPRGTRDQKISQFSSMSVFKIPQLTSMCTKLRNHHSMSSAPLLGAPGTKKLYESSAMFSLQNMFLDKLCPWLLFSLLLFAQHHNVYIYSVNLAQSPHVYKITLHTPMCAKL
jgi:hypothetical protein